MTDETKPPENESMHFDAPDVRLVPLTDIDAFVTIRATSISTRRPSSPSSSWAAATVTRGARNSLPSP